MNSWPHGENKELAHWKKQDMCTREMRREGWERGGGETKLGSGGMGTENQRPRESKIRSVRILYTVVELGVDSDDKKMIFKSLK